MSIRDFIQVIVRRWWVIGLVTGLAMAGALAYSRHEQRIYQASATVFAHPSKAVTSAADYANDLSLLSYGSMGATFTSLADSSTMLDQTAAALGIPAGVTDHYTVIASTLSQSTVMQVSVQGPDANLDQRLANAMVRKVAAATAQYFRIFTLTSLDDATKPTAPISPKLTANLLYGAVAGLIVAFILAALSLYWREWMAPAAVAPSRGEASTATQHLPSTQPGHAVLPAGGPSPSPEPSTPAPAIRHALPGSTTQVASGHAAGVSAGKDVLRPTRPTPPSDPNWYDRSSAGAPDAKEHDGEGIRRA